MYVQFTSCVHGNILTKELRVTSYFPYELCLLYELRVTFIARVTSYFLDSIYKLHFIVRVRSYFLDPSYELLLIAQSLK